jgi:hypothetical protein
MGIFSDIFNFFKDLFSGIFDFLKEYLLIIVLVLVAIYFMNPALFSAIIDWLAATALSFGGWVATQAGAFWGWLEGFSMLELLVGAAALWVIEDPQGAIEFLSDAIQSVVGAVTSGVVDALGLKGLFAIAVGVGAVYFLGKGDKKKQLPKTKIDPETGTPVQSDVS